jgi:hypothetical protein
VGCHNVRRSKCAFSRYNRFQTERKNTFLDSEIPFLKIVYTVITSKAMINRICINLSVGHDMDDLIKGCYHSRLFQNLKRVDSDQSVIKQMDTCVD